MKVLSAVAALLLIWVALIVVGAVVKGLFWLIIVGAVLFVVTAGYGWVRRRGSTAARRN